MRNKNYFPTLDLTRFISCLIVMIPHCFYSSLPSHIEQPNNLKKVLYANAELAVYYFFVLSGFVITWSILEQIKKDGNKFNIGVFYLHRILRIFPLYYLCVFVGFVVFPFFKVVMHQEYNETASVLLSSTFLNNFNLLYHGPPDASVLAILWTIAIEQQFYTFWPLLFLFPSSKSNLMRIISVIILLSILFRTLYFKEININIHTFGLFSYLAFGGFTAILCQNFHIHKLPKVLVFISYGCLVYLMTSGNILFQNVYMAILKPVLLSLIFCIIIVNLSLSKSTLIKVNENTLLVKLGKISYGLYCYHQMIILMFVQLFTFIIMDYWIKTAIIFALSITTTILVSHFSYYYFELKLITFGKNMFNKNSKFKSEKVTA